MLRSELLEIIANGENSGIEFKRDDIRPEQLAKEVAAMANVQGCRILIGVEDDGKISGLKRPNTQEWVLNVFRDKVHPQLIPYYEEIQMAERKKVAVISFAQGISKPYVLRHNNREDVYIRMGNRSELASREQQLRLFETGGLLHIEVLPVSNSTIASLDLERLRYYLGSVIGDPEIPQNEQEWINRLLGLGFMAQDTFGNPVGSIAGLVLFGIKPRRYLRQAGLRVMAFSGYDKEYRALSDSVVDAPMVGRWAIDEKGNKILVDEGLIEKFTTLIAPFISEEYDTIDNHLRRDKKWFYPREAVRETVINALAHRDWTRSVDIEIGSYADRLEIISPGKLQNTMTIEKMKAGRRSTRNQIIVEVLRDYGYVDARGMGIRTKVIPLMKKMNNVEPYFEDSEDYLMTILPKAPKNHGT